MVTSLIPKSLATRVGQVVYDASIEENVPITEDMLDKYLTAKDMLDKDLTEKEQMYHGFVQLAEALAEVRDYRLYVVVNCYCFKEWITNMAGMSRRKVYNYLRIVDKYANPQGIVRLTEEMEQLGMSKLLVATMLPKKDFERFKRTGDIDLGDGRRLHVEDIRTLSVRDFESAIRAKTGKRERQSRRPTEERSRRQELQRLLHDFEEYLVHLQDEDYEKWEAELRRISTEVAKNTQPRDDKEVQRSILDCERNHK